MWNTVTIVGVGLIGGSIGLAVKSRGLARQVIGVGRDARTLERAREAGVIDQAAINLEDGVASADLIVVCTPVDRIAEDVVRSARFAPRRAVITDAGSTKGNILRELQGRLSPEQALFVGSHPLAGSEKKGAVNARADLFANRLVVVTPTADTDLEAVAVVERFWRLLEARVIRMDPELHDRALATTSHLPHAVASALAGVTPVEWLPLTAGGFCDSTRIAAADPALWTAIFLANQAAVLAATEQYLQRLSAFRDALAAGNAPAIHDWLAEGKVVRDALGS
jgi:cyclohexadieny/prephenate dehydrogenase